MKIVNLTVDLIQEGLQSLKESLHGHKLLSDDFKKRNNLPINEEYAITTIGKSTMSRHASITVGEVITIKQEANMKRYRLQIQYPITEADMHLMHFDSISVSWIYDRNGKDISDGECRIEGIPESWLTPIEDKPIAAEEIRTNIRVQDNNNTKSVGRLMYECAEAGIKSGRLEMDLEYKELREAAKNVFIRLDEYRCVDDLGRHALKEALKNLQPIEEI